MPQLLSLRAALARFTARRAAACHAHAPRRADLWLRIGAALSPVLGEVHRALVHHRRAREDRWGAVAAARDASVRFPANADAWMLLGDAYQWVFRQREALGAYEQALALEERADAGMAAGLLYRRAGQHAEAAARFAGAYAAGGGAEALWENALALLQAGDQSAADGALELWATLMPDGLDRLPRARAELRAAAERSDGAAASG
jgi:tetratricopeptide (TPR) repeat protein